MVTPTPITDELIRRARDVRMVVADMDGTLLDENSRFPDGIWETISRLHERGIVFVPASGRQYYKLAKMFEPVLDGLAIISENGAYLLNNGEEVYSAALEREVMERAATIVETQLDPVKNPMLVCGKKSAYTDATDPEFLAECRKYNERLEIIGGIRDFDDDILKFSIFDYDDAEANVEPYLAEIAQHHRVAVAAQTWVDILTPSVNKGIALEHLQEAMGISPDQTLAFGDFLNDLEMIENAEFSFGMANAHPGIIEAANFVAPPNNENGVLRVINELLQL